MIILVGNTMAGYPEGGGHWSVRLQYMLGLRDLGVEFLWLELFPAKRSRSEDLKLIEVFFERFRSYDLDGHCVVARHGGGEPPTFEELEVFNLAKDKLAETIARATAVWNFHCSLREPLLSMFRKKVLLDLDPGHLQVSALKWGMNIASHDLFFTVGTNMDQESCRSPKLGCRWRPFLPPVFLPFWIHHKAPGKQARFTSITQWNWGSAGYLGEKLLSASKRDAYMRYLEVPSLAGLTIELAVNLDPNDTTGDRELLRANRWRVVSPHRLAPTPERYRDYIVGSRGEFGCAKPIHSELRTGWFSDRSAAFLACGRPVVIEETGLGLGLPKDCGILAFTSPEEAAEQLATCTARYDEHSFAAREVAESFFDSAKILPELLNASG